MNKPGEHIRNHYRKQGAEAERERVTKLLEQYFWVGDKSDYGLSKLIALIKEENK